MIIIQLLLFHIQRFVFFFLSPSSIVADVVQCFANKFLFLVGHHRQDPIPNHCVAVVFVVATAFVSQKLICCLFTYCCVTPVNSFTYTIVILLFFAHFFFFCANLSQNKYFDHVRFLVAL